MRMYSYGSMGGMMGYGHGGGMFLCGLIGTIVFIDLVLVGMWLWKRIQKEGGMTCGCKKDCVKDCCKKEDTKGM